FGAGLAGQWFALLVIAVATGFAFGAFGILFASFMPDRETLERGSTAVILPMSALGGSMVPMEMLPGWVQTVGRLFPNGQAVVAFDKVGARHMALADVTPQLVYLVIFTLVAFLWASLRWRKRWLA
ncbi:ABC transporter permease, partial [bacterium]|nr:ABC transporter permease [bacterium]